VDFTIAFVVLLLVLAGYGMVPSPWALVVLPLALLIAMMTAVGIGSWLAALNVQYRDVKQITPFLLQIWMYASPIVYPLSLVPRELHAVYALNPMVGVVAGFRSVLLGREAPPWPELSIAVLSSATLLVAGTLFFRHTERTFADVA
jgi:lipopolysaccharide transport system permease protein